MMKNELIIDFNFWKVKLDANCISKLIPYGLSMILGSLIFTWQVWYCCVVNECKLSVVSAGEASLDMQQDREYTVAYATLAQVRPGSQDPSPSPSPKPKPRYVIYIIFIQHTFIKVPNFIIETVKIKYFFYVIYITEIKFSCCHANLRLFLALPTIHLRWSCLSYPYHPPAWVCLFVRALSIL